MNKATHEGHPSDNQPLDGAPQASGESDAAGSAPDTDDIVAEDNGSDGDNSAKMAGSPGGEADWKDKYLRLSAEFDNYRKRTLREKLDLVASGGEEVIRALLPTLDDVDRAAQAVEEARDLDSVRQGVALITQKLRSTLKDRGLAEMEALDSELDTDLHEAVAMVPADKARRGRVIDVVQKGYMLRDKVIRHAKVVVGE